MKNQLLKLINLSCCSVLALNSCATKDVNANIDHVASKISNIKESAEKTNSIVNHNFITTVSEGMFTSQVTKDRHSTQLPQIFYSTIKVNNTFTSLKSAGDAISDLTGISVDVANADSKRDTAAKSVYIYQTSGNLVNLLDKIATKYDVEWTYNDGVIEFNRLQTYTWSINAIPGDYSMQNNIINTVGLNATNSNSTSSIGSGSSSSSGSNSSSQTGTSQGTQTLAFNSSANLWSNISNTVKSMLSAEGSVSVSQADSTLTVNDRPHVVRLVGRYIAKENEIIGRQVKLEVKLLTVSVSDEDNYNINWAAVLNGTSAGAALASTAGSSLGSSFTINATSGDLSGSSLIVNALSEKDKTSVVTDATVITHNNQPVPLQSSTQTSYVASSQTTLVSNAGSETTLTPGVVTTGFTMNVLPNILANKEVNLQITLNLSTLVSMTSSSAGSAESGTSTIQLPSVATKSFMQRVSMHSGQTLVLSGFDEGDNKLSQKGVGSSSWWWFGGGPDNKKTHEVLVVLITPQVMETN